MQTKIIKYKVLQVLASTPSSRNDGLSSSPELTLILNDTSPLFYNVSVPKEVPMNTTILIRADEMLHNVTLEPVQQQISRTRFDFLFY